MSRRGQTGRDSPLLSAWQTREIFPSPIDVKVNLTDHGLFVGCRLRNVRHYLKTTYDFIFKHSKHARIVKLASIQTPDTGKIRNLD